MATINCGVIGLGRIGQIHLDNLNRRVDGAAVIAVSDPQEEARAVAAGNGIKNVCHNAEEVIDDQSVEAVIICSPTHTHARYVKLAAERGKAIFCEKPLETDIGLIKELIKVVKSNDTMLMVGFNRRFDTDFSKIRQTVSQGKLGELQLLRITSRDPGPPPLEYIKSSGGIFLDMSIHDFDMARFIVGAEVKEVFSKGVAFDSRIGALNDYDTTVTTLFFENGVIGTIDNSRKAVYGYDQRLEIFGSLGKAKIGNHKADSLKLYNSQGSSSSPLLHFFLERYKEAYYNEMQAFINAIVNHQPSPVNALDGLMSVALALAAKRSVLENRPVEVKEILD